jgi:hypothetical protein
MTPSHSIRPLIFTLVLMSTSMIAEAQTLASCSFKLFQLPKSTSSLAYGVNDSGAVVGSAPVSPSAQGFTRTASGAVTYYCAPGAGCTEYSSLTYFTGRNDAGVDVGVYKTPTMGDPEGFMLKGSTFTPIQEPNSVYGTYTNGINKSNTVVGSYLDSQTHSHGFQRSSEGSYITLDYPGAQNTYPLGINDNGVIVGAYYSGQGFIYEDGEWTTLDYPGASSTELNGISDAGVIIGNSNATTQGTAFLYENGVVKVIAAPNTYSTSVSAISADGLIVGMTNLNDTESGWRGFTATCK